MRTVLLLYGGRSGEHEVSLLSAASVARNLGPDWSVILGGIDKDGRWYLQSDEELRRAKEDPSLPLRVVTDPASVMSVIPGQGIAAAGKLLAIDVVFPVLHGSFGEDGLVQGLLETAMLPYAGSGVLGSSLSMDKDTAKRVWKEAGLPLVSSVTLRKDVFENAPDGCGAFIGAVETEFGYPLFIKPSAAGSSVGITMARSREQILPALEKAFRIDTKVLIEKAIDAREIECSVLGNSSPRAFTPGEIIPSHEFYDYDAKYLDPQGARLVIPAQLTEAELAQIKRLAIAAYTAAEAEGFARVDFFVEKNSGRIFLNEINTIPGFTAISMFPRMCAAGGLPYAELLDEILRLGIRRHSERSGLSYSYQCS
ncbi:MAG: D-alanine--D-alanine ligase [Spirochaetaceae bacterium]|nr:D-alanine--D-alanine ligase [Spirochaetaceae bacterium]